MGGVYISNCPRCGRAIDSSANCTLVERGGRLSLLHEKCPSWWNAVGRAFLRFLRALIGKGSVAP